MSGLLEVAGTSAPRVSEFRRIRRVMASRWVVVFGALSILLFILLALTAPWLAPYGPLEQDLMATLQPPSWRHLLGTDDLGRDVLSRILYGARISLLVGIVVVTIAGVIGMFMGLLAGYFGGWINAVIMRVNDALMSLPPIVLMLAISAVLGGGLKSILISVGIVLAPTYCRLMCGQILTLKESDFITAAHVIGAGNLRIMVRHLVPNAFPPLLVLVTINLGTAIMFEATLSFLGIGIAPPTAAWGSMVMTGYRYLLKNPVLSFAPGLSIMLLVLGFNMVGDGLRDALDPRLKGRI
jgi:peptide/nickel transport system permease protein/oligopeptide transport system permease protein